MLHRSHQLEGALIAALGTIGRLLAIAALAAAVAACGAAPPPSPDAPCAGVDVDPTPGYYPALESLLPATLASATPGIVNSGRTCSSAALDGLASAGIIDLHFAGAQYPASATTGASLVIYTAPGLTPTALANAFTASAASDSTGSVNQIQTSAVTIAGRPGIRIQVNNNDQLQTIIFWPAARPDTVNAVLAAGLNDTQVQAAIAAFGTR